MNWGCSASVTYRTDSAERLAHTDLIRDFASPSRGWSDAACNYFKWAALCCRGALPTVSPDEFRRERNQDDCGYDQQSRLHPKVAEQAAATACLTTLHVHLCGPPCDTAAQTADLSKGKASFRPFDFVCKTSSVRRNTSCAARFRSVTTHCSKSMQRPEGLNGVMQCPRNERRTWRNCAPNWCGTGMTSRPSGRPS